MRSAKWLMLCAVALLPRIASAQYDVNRDPQATAPAPEHPFPKTSVMGPIEPNSPWGAQRGAKWIAASQFDVRLSSSAPMLTYAGFHFYDSPGTVGTTRYFAELDVEPGALVDLLTCVYNDTSATNDLQFQLQKYVTNLSTGLSTSSLLASFTTSGTPGVGFDFLQPAVPETITTTDGIQQLFNYYIAADVGGDTSFAGCWVWYKRQVAPGPSSASFADVPTTSPYFKFIEALSAAGVVGGCGSGNYCPNSPVNRGQMAVFLASALGMGYPY